MGVVLELFRSVFSWPSPTSSLWQADPLVSEVKYRNGLRHARYVSLAVASWGTLLPIFGTRQADFALDGTPWRYAFQVSPA